MADDLLEEIDGEGDIQEMQRDGDAASEKPSLLKRLTANKKRLVMFGGGTLLLLLILGGVFFFLSGSDEDAAVPEKGKITEEEIQAALEKAPEIVFEDIVVLEPFERIPLKGGSAMRTISLGISLELTDHNHRKLVVTVEDRIRKVVSSQVREMTWLELRSPEGKLRLKYDLLKRMNNLFPKVTIRNIYFTNFIMQ